jgi:isoamylase
MRDFWRSHPVGLGEFAARFCGSSDMYSRARRRPTASVNLITVHDGFTLRDLVSYNDKRNEANGESNRDGTSDNRSWNCGADGPTDDPAVLALRARQSRAMLTTLLLSFGIPMLLGGDEMGRTQQGTSGVPPQPVPGRSRSCRVALVHPVGHRDDRRRLVGRGRPGHRAVPGRIR